MSITLIGGVYVHNLNIETKKRNLNSCLQSMCLQEKQCLHPKTTMKNQILFKKKRKPLTFEIASCCENKYIFLNYYFRMK